MTKGGTFTEVLDDIDLLSCQRVGVDTEWYRVAEPSRAFPHIMERIAERVRNGTVVTHYCIALFEPVWTDSVDGVLYIEDWYEGQFSLDAPLDDDAAVRSRVIEQKTEQKCLLRDQYGIDDDWTVLVDRYDATAGAGAYGQIQYVAYDATSCDEE